MSQIYLYALARMNAKTDYHHVDKSTLEEARPDAVYYGVTANPQQRLAQHRHRKGHDLGMIVVDESSDPYEALYKEAAAVWEHVKATGLPPALQKPANSGTSSKGASL